jgi:hypothetical protein
MRHSQNFWDGGWVIGGGSDGMLTIDKLNRQPHLQGRQRLRYRWLTKTEALRARNGTSSNSSEGAYATISRHLQVVAVNVPLSNCFFKHRYAVALRRLMFGRCR